ncbi:MAG: hypothetical protein K1X78_03475 [Verrucomicrobiaceae bacterium]|nr:hypothetical protein [Verrucomicrobiaceae bacterium]
MGDAGKKLRGDLVDLISSLAGNIAASEIDKAVTPAQRQHLDHANQHFVRFTGCVVEALLRQVVGEREFNLLSSQRSAAVRDREALRQKLLDALAGLPEAWMKFVHGQKEGEGTLAQADFVRELEQAQLGKSDGPAIEPAVLQKFLAGWLTGLLGDQSDPAGLAGELAASIAPRVSRALSDAIGTDHPAARAALAKSLLRYQAEFGQHLVAIREGLADLHEKADRIEAALLGRGPGKPAAAGPLRVFHEQPEEFRRDLLESPHAWFLVDGLDEIGSPEKRRALAAALHEGMLRHPRARWLVTSRIVGYAEAPVHLHGFKAEVVTAERKRKVLEDFKVLYIPEAKGPGTDELLGIPKIEREDLSFTIALNWLSSWLHTQVLSQSQRLIERAKRNLGHAVGIQDAFDDAAKPIHAIGLGAEPPGVLEECREDLEDRIDPRPEDTEVEVEPGEPFTFPVANVRYLAPFDDRQRRDFLVKWFQLRDYSFPDQTVDAFVDGHIADIDQREAEGVRLLSRIPNMLSYMAVLVRDKTPLPDGRARLYHAIAHAYLESLDYEHKHIFALPGREPGTPADRFPPVTPMQARECLRRLAIALMWRQGDGDAAAGAPVNRVGAAEALAVLQPLIESWLRDTHFSAHHRGRDHGQIVAAILHHLSRRSGLILPVGPEEHGFVHLSFLEFFAAEWLSAELTRLNDRDAETTRKARLAPAALAAHLDAKYPPPPDFAYGKEDLHALADRTAWRETLIFLAELRADPERGHQDAQDVLVELLFPPLVPTEPLDQPLPALTSEECKLTGNVPLSFAAAQLAIRISQDPAIALDPALCQHWWRTLWVHRLRCTREEYEGDPEKAWHIAPELLRREAIRPAALQSLDAALQIFTADGTRCLERELDLRDCTTLRGGDLASLRCGRCIHELYLAGCTGLTDLTGLRALRALRELWLDRCTGLHGAGVLEPLRGLDKLMRFSLSGCTGLTDLTGLGALGALRELWLDWCTGLHGAGVLEPLRGLDKLERLSLMHCTGLTDLTGLGALGALRELWLDRCTGLQGAGVLEPLRRLDHLDLINLCRCPGLDEEGVKAFEKAVRDRRGANGPEFHCELR